MVAGSRVAIFALALAAAAAAWPVNDRMKTMFETALDEDANGAMSVEELRSFVSRIEDTASTKDVLPLFRMMDLDGDNSVSLDEFKSKYARLTDSVRYRNDTAPEQVHIQCTTNPTEMIIIWVTFASSNGHFVQYGTQPGVYTAQGSGYEYTYTVGVPAWAGFLHRVLVTGLVPGTRYYYRVGDGVNWSPEFNFVAVPEPGSGEGLSYMVYGDMGTFMLFGFLVTDEIVRVDQVEDYALTFHLGDVSYAGGGVFGGDGEASAIWDIWGRQIEPVAAYYPYMISLGNHESSYNYTAFKARHEMPGQGSGGQGNQFYSFDHGLVHFVSMSSENDAAPYAVGSPQYNFLRADLEKANNNRARVPWIVMGGHRPMYGSSGAGYWEDIRLNLEPLLKEFNVDLFVAGHVHVYERSHAVYDYVVSDLPSADQVYTNPSSPIHVTIGTSGAMIWDRWLPLPDWAAVRLRNYGWSDFKVTPTELTFTFKSGTSGPDWPEDSDGSYKVTDYFKIVKN